MNAYTGLNTGTNVFTPVGKDDYRERVSYDANGNILTYLRNGVAATHLSMDNLSYNYLPGTNQLGHVDDAVGSGNYTENIDDQDEGNYAYDAIGNLTRDSKEGIGSNGIKWNVYGKIAEIIKTVSSVTTTVRYTYDAGGNRIGKWVQAGSDTPKQTWYVRDATGNAMAVYEKGVSAVNSGRLSQIEVSLYGSSRLGLWRPLRDVEEEDWVLFDKDPMTGTAGAVKEAWVRGRTQYELSNHLGNVLVTISDPVYQYWYRKELNYVMIRITRHVTARLIISVQRC